MRKILCSVLSLVMCVGLFANTVFAQSTPYLDVAFDATSFETQSELITQNKVTFGETEDKIKYALFDKTKGQYMMLEENVFTNENTTVEMWVNLDETDTNERALFSAGTTPAKHSYQATVANGKLTVSLKHKTSGDSETQSVDLPSDYVGEWIYLAFVETVTDGAVTINAYINPASASATPSLTVGPFTMDSTDYDNAFVGATGSAQNPNKDNGLSGKIAALRIYKKAFTAEEVFAGYDAGIIPEDDNTEGTNPDTPDPNPDTPNPDTPQPDPDPDTPTQEGGLVYDLEIGQSFETSRDAFAPNVALRYNSAGNAPTVMKYRGVGNEFNYMRFNDPAEMENREFRAPVNIDTTNIPASDELTFEIWAKLENSSAGTNEAFLSVKAVTPDSQTVDILQVLSLTGYGLVPKLYGSQWNDGNGEISTSVGGASATVGGKEWHHLVFTRIHSADATTLKVWVDGQNPINVSKVLTNKTIEDQYVISLCGWPNSQQSGIAADIADFKIYTKQLTDEEVAEKYSSTKDKFITPEFYYDSDSELGVNSNNVTLTMSNPQKTDSTIETLKVTDENKNPFAATITNDSGNLLLTFNQYLRYGMKLKVANIVTDGYNFVNVEGGPASFKAEKSGNDVVLTINSSTAGQYKYAVSQRRNNGASIKTAGETVDVSSSAPSVINTPIEQGAEKIYVYVWEVRGQNLIPVQSSPIILE